MVVILTFYSYRPLNNPAVGAYFDKTNGRGLPWTADNEPDKPEYNVYNVQLNVDQQP